MARPLIRVDPCFAAAIVRPQRICDTAVVCRDDLVAAGAPGVVARP
jgi:hypothetical protein